MQQPHPKPDHELSLTIRTELARRLCKLGWSVEGPWDAEELQLLPDSFLGFPIHVPVVNLSASSPAPDPDSAVIELVELYQKRITKRLEMDRHSAVNRYLRELQAVCVQVMKHGLTASA